MLPWWFSSKESACQCRRCGIDPPVRKTPWRRKWQPHSSILARRISQTEEPGGLQFMQLQRVIHNLVTKQQQQEAGEIRWLLPSLNALDEANKKLRWTIWKLKAKCKRQSISLVLNKVVLISSAGEQRKLWTSLRNSQVS